MFAVRLTVCGVRLFFYVHHTVSVSYQHNMQLYFLISNAFWADADNGVAHLVSLIHHMLSDQLPNY